MKIRSHIQGCLVAALLLAGCNQEQEQATGAPILFETEVQTKAVPTTIDNIADFGVYAYLTGTDLWDKATSATTWLDNESIFRQGNSWAGNHTFYWPVEPQKHLTFFAYSPRANNYNGILIVPPTTPGGANADNNVPVIQFEISKDIPTQTDLLVAPLCSDLTNATLVVPLKFVHTTTKIAFRAYSPAPGTSIQSITLTNLPYKGTMPIDGKTEWTIDVSSTDFEYYLNGIIVSADPNKPTLLSEPSRYFLLFPQAFTASSNARIVVTFANASGDEFTKSALLLETWEMGKSLAYTLELNAEKNEDLIVKQVIVTDWKFDAGGNQSVDTKGEQHQFTLDANGGALKSEHIAFNITYEHGSMPLIPTEKPDSPASGGTFKEWNTASNGTGQAHQPGTRIKVIAPVTLYAIWI